MTQRNKRLPLWPTIAFLSERMHPTRKQPSSKVHTLIRLAIPAIALSVAVMLLTVSVISGFKGGVRQLVRVMGGDIILNQYGKTYNDIESHVQVPPSMLSELKGYSGIEGVRTVLQSAGIVKTDSAYRGVSVVGFDTHWQRELYQPLLVEGQLPFFSEQDTIPNPVLLPASMARNLQIKVGDKVKIYIVTPDIKLRAFTVCGLLELDASAQPMVLVPQTSLRKALRLQPDYYSRIELFVRRGNAPEETADKLTDFLSQSNYVQTQTLGILTASEVNVNVYDWIGMLDSNATTLLVLMGLVCAFTLINCLLILILDRIYTIGTLKALGMNNHGVTLLFLTLSMHIILLGLFWGNLLALLVAWIQKNYHLLPLDPTTYYLSYVPVELNPLHWLAVNASTFVLCMSLLLLPARIITRISPAKSIKIL